MLMNTSLLESSLLMIPMLVIMLGLANVAYAARE